MNKNDPLFIYLLTLSIIQPARIQDIEGSLGDWMPESIMSGLRPGVMREIHKIARDRGLVVSVRRGSYCLSKMAWRIVRSGGLSTQIDNRRFFLMKQERKELY